MMTRLVWASLRRGPAAVFATFLTLFLAVITVTAFGSVFGAGIGYHGTVARYAAAPVLVAATDAKFKGPGDDGATDSVPLTERMQLPPTLPATIAALPGVRAAVSDVAIPARLTVGDGAATVEAHPWSAAQLAPFRLSSGAAPTGTRTAVLSASLASRLRVRVGQTVTLALPAGLHQFSVSGIAATTGAAPRTPTVFLSDAEAATAAQHGTEVIGVLPRPGVSTSTVAAEVNRALPAPSGSSAARPQVYTGASRGSVEGIDVDNAQAYVIALSSSFGGSALLMALIVIAGTVGLSVKLRNRDIALLRAVAATPRQVRRMLVRETLALSALASLLGILPGIAAAHWLRKQYVAHQIVPADFTLHGSLIPLAVAAAATALIGAGAAWIASRRPSRIPASAALAEAAVERRKLGLVRVGLGLVALAGGIVLSTLSSKLAGDAGASIAVGTVFALTAAVGLLAPLIVRMTAAVLGVALRWFGATGRLAAANLNHYAGQLASVVAALVLVVAVGGSLWFLQSSEEHVSAQEAKAGLVAGDVVTPSPPGISSHAVTALRATPGVSAATGMVKSSMLSTSEDGTSFTAEGIDLTGLNRTVDLGVTSGSLSGLKHPGTVAIDTVTAKSLNLHVGGVFHGWFGDGVPANLRVVAVYSRGLGFAQFTLSRSALVQHTTSSLDNTVYVAMNGNDPRAAAAVRQKLDQLAPGASLVSANRYRVALNEDLAQNAWTNQLITVVLLAYVAIGALNTLIMYILGRGRELALLRMAGTTRRQIRRMVTLEQSLLLGMTLTLGAVIAAATLVPMVKGLTGASSPYIPATGWIAVVGGIVALGAGATIAPLRRVLGQRPIEAVGVRE